MPSVAMNGGTFSLAMMIPETAPHSAPNASAATTPRINGMPQLVSTTPHMTAVKVISVPTERSMPPVMMTKVQATPSTPLTAVACRMPTTFVFAQEVRRGDAEIGDQRDQHDERDRLLQRRDGEKGRELDGAAGSTSGDQVMQSS